MEISSNGLFFLERFLVPSWITHKSISKEKISGRASPQRYLFVDQIRGFAVFLMIIFHLIYDLTFFRYVLLDFQNDLLRIFPKIIVFLFLLSVGFSLSLAHPQKVQWKAFWKRWIRLIFCALIISLTTYMLFPQRWIYFGTLHCISLCSLIVLPFLRHPLLALITSLVLPLPLFLGLDYPWIRLAHKSMDYIPPFPWISSVLMGVWLHHLGVHKILLPRNFFTIRISLLGRHALLIYLLHQPVLFGLFSLLSFAGFP